MSKKRKDLRNAPIDRFIWKEGDVKIIHDPYAEKRRKQEVSDNHTAKEGKEEGEGSATELT